MSEMGLIIFSLLIQLSAGTWLIHAAMHFFSRETSGPESREPRISLLALSAGVAGLAASFLHLGSPCNAVHALANLTSSWMSREIMLATLFIAAMASTAVVTRLSAGSKMMIFLRNACSVFAILLLYSMIKLWSVPGAGTGSAEGIWIGFIATSLFLGSVALALLSFKNTTIAGNLLFLALISLIVSLLNLLVFSSGFPAHQSLVLTAALLYILAVAASLPAMIPRFKNIFVPFAVIMIILGLAAEIINRIVLFSLTAYNL